MPRLESSAFQAYLPYMRDELLKIAVSVGQLSGLARRMPLIRTKAFLGKNPGIADLKQISGQVGMAAIAPPAVAKAQLGIHARGMSPEDAKEFWQHPGVKDTLQSAKDVGGNIIVSRGGMGRLMDSIAKRRPGFASTRGMSSAGQKALNLVGIGHEAAERTTRARHVAPFAGHLSPDVLVREHNMLSTLSGPGAGEARKYMRGVRQTLGEADAMREVFAKRFGPRGPEFLAEGKKVPKAMRKRFGEWAGSGDMMREMAGG